ncbi:hypothetical protein EVAR_68298_1 [Eumeta japonica]|uniref:Uncharacterized protein n=1 Tax=Eumeta variegata TaxID=151549 RepID=A0A4C2ADF9_EUMVA|nr:hypothetical protein EVAR_68298_1 [Eumeta japonica]
MGTINKTTHMTVFYACSNKYARRPLARPAPHVAMHYFMIAFTEIKGPSESRRLRILLSGINTSPYEAMFGCKPKIGLKTFLPAVDISHITSEEDLERLQDPQYADTDDCNSLDHTADVHLVDIHCQQIEPTSNIYPVDAHSVHIEPELQSELEINSNQENPKEIPVDNANKEETNISSENQNIDEELVSIIATTSTKIQEVRDSVRKSLQKQTEKMLKLSKTKFPVGKIGESVRKRKESKINADEKRSLRSMNGMSRKDRYRNSDVKKWCGLKQDVVTKVKCCGGLAMWKG